VRQTLTRRYLGAAALAMAGTVTAAACAGPGAAREPAAAPALRPGVTLTLVHFYPAAQQDNIKRRVALFKQETPGIDVEEAALPGGAAYRERLLATFAGDVPPDVMHMSAAPGSGYAFGVFAPLGRFFELGPLAKRDRYDLDDYYKVALDFNSFGGKLYVVPNDLNVFATYWNTELFQQAGVTAPPVDWKSAGFDLAALLDAARRLTVREGGAGAAGGAISPLDRYGMLIQPTVQPLLPFLWSNGADVLSRDHKRITLDEPAALETLQYLADFVTRHRAAPASDELAAGSGANALFFAGRLAMFHTGSNFVNQLRTQAKALAYDVGASPRGRSRRASVAGGAGFAGAAQGKNREEAWALLKHLGGQASLEIGAREGQMPTRRSVARSSAFLDPSQPPANRRVFLEAAENAGPNPMVSNWAEVEDAINKALAPLFDGKRGVREAVAEAKQQGETLLAQGQAFQK
jgi:multiple sugar transport system substrate-binding protein